jgi:hypothetical protein
MESVLQIVPKLPPRICGVGDYALVLARLLRDEHGVMTTFAVVDANEEFEIEGFKAMPLAAEACAVEQRAAGFARVLLHYVGYGYQNRGCPVWLMRGIRRLKIAYPNQRLVTMFHELYATGRPWQSSFWTQPLQKSICRTIARSSGGVVTNRLASAEVLRQMTGCEVRHLPVFSTIGEPNRCTEFDLRNRRLVLFGGPGWRSKALETDLEALKDVCQRWDIHEGIEIGPGTTAEPNLGIPWTKLGTLPAEEISAYLSSSMFGFVSYPSTYLEKSTTFAAYAAHGLVPVLPSSCVAVDTLGISPGRHFLSSARQAMDDSGLKEVSASAYAWYQDHGSTSQSGVFAKLLK